MKNKMHIESLIKKFYLGNLTNEELTFLLSYMKKSEPHNQILELYQTMWDKADSSKSELDSKDIYNKVVSKIEVNEVKVRLEPVKGRPENVEYRYYFRLVLRYAAVFILAFGLSWLVHSFLSDKVIPQIIADQIQTIEVPFGSKSRIVLPDNSVVTLNSGSSLKYSSSGFNSDNRNVSLTGEGFFSVTKDSTKPFYVTTPGIKVKVLGTTFNLKAYPDEYIEEATLIEGKVEIYASNDSNEEGKPIILKPNQNAIFSKSSEIVKPVGASINNKPVITPVKLRTIELQPSSEIAQTIAWKDNTLIFDNEPFSSLSVKLERWYNVKFLIDYQELNSIRFSGKFDKETLEQVMKALVTTTPFNYTVKQDIVTILKSK